MNSKKLMTNLIIENILNKLEIDFNIENDEIIMLAPNFRLDLNIPEDFIDEIGRIFNYENIKPILPSNINSKIEILPIIYFSEKIKNILFDLDNL